MCNDGGGHVTWCIIPLYLSSKLLHLHHYRGVYVIPSVNSLHGRFIFMLQYSNMNYSCDALRMARCYIHKVGSFLLWGVSFYNLHP